ncbi:MAG: homospermidine synthase [Alphaproteobacteria bacterium]|jgi:homospermidine synthase
MTDFNDKSTLKHDSASNMESLKNAITNGQENRLKALLTNLLLDELQKGYLINLAENNGNSKIVRLLNALPATP